MTSFLQVKGWRDHYWKETDFSYAAFGGRSSTQGARDRVMRHCKSNKAINEMVFAIHLYGYKFVTETMKYPKYV